MLFHDPDEETSERSAGMLRSTGQDVTVRDFRTCNQFDVRERLCEVEVPALAITGAHDSLTPPTFHEYLADTLPQGEHALVDAAAHLSFLERPDIWNRKVRAFIDGL